MMELQDKFCSQCLATDYVGCLKEQQRWANEQKTIGATLARQEKEFQISIGATVLESRIYFYGPEQGSFGFLSQFYPSMFEGADGAVYHCAEQWMMASKAKIMGDKVTWRLIMDAEYDPTKIKRLGRMVTPWIEEKWIEARERVVRERPLVPEVI